MQSIKRLCLLLIFTLFATGTMIAGQVLAADWYDSGWNYRQKITIDESMIPDNGDLSDFPVLIQFTSADNNPVFANARSDGYDILFTESDGTSLLDHEIEEYNSSTEDLNMWVRIPVLDDDGPTEIYMYYGNPSITTDPSTSSAWNSGFAGVWHYKENGTDSNPGDGLDTYDSTANNNDGFLGANGETSETNDPAWTTTNTKINSALDYTKSQGDRVRVNHDSSLLFTTAGTVEFWVKFEQDSTDAATYPCFTRLVSKFGNNTN